MTNGGGPDHGWGTVSETRPKETKDQGTGKRAEKTEAVPQADPTEKKKVESQSPTANCT